MCLLRPHSFFYRVWILIILTFILYNSIIIPFEIGFEYSFGSSILILNFIADSFFILDIILNFHIAYYFEGELVKDLKKIRWNYLTGWFSIDLIASLPLSSLAMLMEIDTIGGIAILPLLRINRLLRVTRILKYFHIYEKFIHINPILIRLIKLFLTVLHCVHWTACAWYKIALVEGVSHESWIEVHKLINTGIYDQYAHSIYWALTTMTTVGYGDITPNTTNEIVFAMISMLIGVSIYAYIIGNMASLVANIDASAQAYRKKMDFINDYIRFRKIPIDLQDRIRNYYDYVWTRNKGVNEVSLLSDLPLALRTEVDLFLHKEILEKVPLFHDANLVFLSALVKMLKPAINAPGDYIITEGEVGHEMFFISRGSVEVISGDGKTVYATLSDGSFFGEIALLFSEKRTASIRAITYCDLFILSKHDFKSALNDFPEFAEKMLQIAKERYKKQK